jgi:gas vesicle protein
MRHQSWNATKVVRGKIQEKQEPTMSRNDSTGSFLIFLVGIGVGAAAVLLLGSKRIDELRDDVSEALNDGMDEVRKRTKDLRRQTQKAVNTAQQKVQELIDAGADAYGEAKRP